MKNISIPFTLPPFSNKRSSYLYDIRHHNAGTEQRHQTELSTHNDGLATYKL